MGMTIKNITDLIEKLQRIKEEHGDIRVAIQYRDEGGTYSGCDTFFEFIIEEHKSSLFGDNIEDGEVVLLL